MKKILVVLMCVLAMTGCTKPDAEKSDKNSSEVEELETGQESQVEDISQQSDEFNFGTGGEIAIMIGDQPSVKVYINSDNAAECSLAFAYYYSSLSDDGMSDYDTSILCSYGNDLSAMWNKTDAGESIVGINSDGSSTSELPDWIITDTEKFTISETEQADILSELQESTLEFLQ